MDGGCRATYGGSLRSGAKLIYVMGAVTLASALVAAGLGVAFARIDYKSFKMPKHLQLLK